MILTKIRFIRSNFFQVMFCLNHVFTERCLVYSNKGRREMSVMKIQFKIIATLPMVSPSQVQITTFSSQLERQTGRRSVRN